MQKLWSNQCCALKQVLMAHSLFVQRKRRRYSWDLPRKPPYQIQY